MKSSIEVLIVMFSFVFGMSVNHWMNSFSPSFNDVKEVEIMKEEEE